MEARSIAPSPPFFGIVSGAPFRPPSRPRPVWSTDGHHEVELRSAAEAAAEIAAWRSLAGRALEPSAFAWPELLLPALQHLPDGRQASLILVWHRTAGVRVLRGLFPVTLPRLSLMPSEVRLWRPQLFPVAGAMVDREHAEAVLAAVLSFCTGRGPCGASFALSPVPAEGGLGYAARRADRRASRETLLATSGRETAPLAPEARPAPIVRARTPAQIRDAVESFLILDAAGAKARRRAALIQDCGAASFLRTATRQLARQRRCRVELLRHDDAAVAATIMLETAEASWLWQSATPHGGALPDALVLSAAASARRRGKRLIACAAAVSTKMAAVLGLEPFPLCDLVLQPGTGLSPGAAITRMRSRIDQGLRAMARGGMPLRRA